MAYCLALCDLLISPGRVSESPHAALLDHCDWPTWAPHVDSSEISLAPCAALPPAETGVPPMGYHINIFVPVKCTEVANWPGVRLAVIPAQVDFAPRRVCHSSFRQASILAVRAFSSRQNRHDSLKDPACKQSILQPQSPVLIKLARLKCFRGRLYERHRVTGWAMGMKSVSVRLAKRLELRRSKRLANTSYLVNMTNLTNSTNLTNTPSRTT